MIQAREKRLREERKTKILILTSILIILITLIPIQTLIWLKNNKPEQPKWFSQTITEEIEFTFGE